MFTGKIVSTNGRAIQLAADIPCHGLLKKFSDLRHSHEESLVLFMLGFQLAAVFQEVDAQREQRGSLVEDVAFIRLDLFEVFHEVGMLCRVRDYDQVKELSTLVTQRLSTTFEHITPNLRSNCM